MKGIGFIVLLYVFFGFSVAGQGSFVVEAPQTEVVAGEVFEVSFIIENIKGDFEPPNFAPFESIAGPMQSSSFQSINGQVSQLYQFKYLLRAPEEGVYLIPEAELLMDNEVLYTDPIEILVLPSGEPSKNIKSNERPSLNQILNGKEIKRF